MKPRTFDYALADQLHRGGMSLSAIARKFGVHHTTVVYAIKTAQDEERNGIIWHPRQEPIKRPKGGRTQVRLRNQAIYELHHKEGLTTNQIMEKLSLPYGQVYSALYYRKQNKPRDPYRVEKMVELAIRIAKRRMRLCA